MQKLPKSGILMVVGVALLGSMLYFSIDSVEARPGYMKVFNAEYPDLEAAKEAKCNVCHEGKSKKMRNAYGKAVGAALGAKNVKEADKVKEGLEEAAGKDSEVEGKTFGDLIKEGKLPGSK